MAERVRLARRPALHSGALFRYTPGMDPTGMSVSRPYQGTYRDQFGMFRTAPADVLRDGHYTLDPVTGIYRRSTLLEPQSTNLLLRSTDVAASPWSAHPSLTPSPAASCIDDQTARRLTAAGTTVDPFVLQTAGTFTGSAETATMIVERGTDTQAVLGIYDVTTGTWVYRARLDYATGIVTPTHGTGTRAARQLTACGPNGGEVWVLRITATGTAGNSRRVYGCPVGTGGLVAGSYGFIHYIGLEVGAIGTSPIVTTDAPVSRPHDKFSFPWPHTPQAMTFYTRFVEGGTILTPATQLPMVAAIAPTALQVNTVRLFLYRPGGTLTYTGFLHNGTDGKSTPALAATPALGQLVELRLVIDADITIYQSINGGPEISSSVALPAGGLPPAWAAGARLHVNGIAAQYVGRNCFTHILALRGERTLAECRARAGVA